MSKVEDWNWETIYYGHYRSSTFNHCDVIDQQSNRNQWKKTQNKGYYAVQGHSRL